MKADWTGITRHGAGYRASVSQGRGRTPLRRHFPASATLAEMQAWRQDAHATRRLARKQRAAAGVFAFDVRIRYLPAVKALPTYAERVQQLDRWIALFGTRWRDSIRPDEIRAQRDRWLTEPRGVDRDGRELPPYAASTVNHWLRALRNVWTVLDGRHAPNPVREVPEAVEPDARPRALAYTDIARLLGQMPACRTTARVRVLAATGLTYRQLGRLTPADVDLDRATMFVSRRGKGKGVAARLLPLTPQAVAAFRALDAAGGWGPFSGSSLYRSFQRAATKARLPGVRPYDLRHSFATLVYQATGSREVTRELLQHADVRTTARYTLAAVDAVLARQLAALGGDPTG